MTVDVRFYVPSGPLSLADLAALTGAHLKGDPQSLITGVGAAVSARAGEIVFFEGRAGQASTISPQAGAVFARPGLQEALSFLPAVLETDNPRLAHARAARALFRPRYLDTSTGADPGGAAAASSGAATRIHPSAVIAPGAVIGSGACIGEDTRIGANSVIGPGVQIGRGTEIGAQVSVQCALIGDHVRILSGARIGETGFGVMAGPQGAEDIPHFGRVILQDHVTIGANTCIDRGGFEDTIIGERTKIDNLCQIGHNVVVGRGVLIAAFGGISGSVRIGDGSMLGGRVGIADHLTIGRGVRLAAGSGVLSDIPDGESWGGFPARPLRQWMREVSWLRKQIRSRKEPD